MCISLRKRISFISLCFFFIVWSNWGFTPPPPSTSRLYGKSPMSLQCWRHLLIMPNVFQQRDLFPCYQTKVLSLFPGKMTLESPQETNYSLLCDSFIHSSVHINPGLNRWLMTSLGLEPFDLATWYFPPSPKVKNCGMNQLISLHFLNQLTLILFIPLFNNFTLSRASLRLKDKSLLETYLWLAKQWLGPTSAT